ncbi:hypothetical protein BGW41_001187 [Actinomortierella wolfii]|nr:hypothetical protein BGW41_001187 [Actinomortierella wolfii]
MAKARSPDPRSWLPIISATDQLDTRRPIVPIVPSAQAMNTAKTLLDLHKHQQQQVHLQHQRHQQQLQQQKEMAHHTQFQGQPMLMRLVNTKDVLPYVLVHLDTRSLLALCAVSTKIRREILMPAVPALNALTLFLERRTVTCPMAMFESLKDFISKYRSFRPAHLHFTYSEQLNLSSTTPMEPIYNSKNDASLVYPSGSPLASTSSQVGIHLRSSDTAHENDHPNPQQMMPDSSRSTSTESVRSNSSYCNDLLSTKISTTTTSSSSLSVAGANSVCDSNEISSTTAEIGKNVNLAPSVASSSTAPTAGSSSSAQENSTHIASLSISSQQLEEKEGQQCTATPTVSNGSGSHTTHADVPNMLTPDTIPVHTTSATPRYRGHGFELSYWQKFALNELFLRSLPFLKTLTIGRTDKPRYYPVDSDAERRSMELATGVCYFLARCFNVMHDMPDTALESVIWMDVTSREVVLLAAMIELRDIVVDDRYWRRGYWTWNSPLALPAYASSSHDDPQYQPNNGESEWEGFYYLLYHDEKDDLPLARRFLPSTASSIASISTSGSASTLNGAGGSDRRLSSPPATPIGLLEDRSRIEQQALNIERGSVPMERNASLVRAGSSPDTRTIARLTGATVSLDSISMTTSSSSSPSPSAQDLSSSSWMPSMAPGGVGSSSMHELAQSNGGASQMGTVRQQTMQSHHHHQNGTVTSTFADAETDLVVQVYKELRRRVAESTPTYMTPIQAGKRIAVSNGSSHSTVCREEQMAVDRKGKAPIPQESFSRLSIQY